MKNASVPILVLALLGLSLGAVGALNAEAG